VGNDLGIYRGRAKINRGGGARYSRLLPWNLSVFFLCLVWKTQASQWTERMVNTRLITQDPRNCPGPEGKGP